MSNQIQGRDVTVKLFLNGQCIESFPVKKFDAEAKQEVRDRSLVGKRRVTSQVIIEGYKGSIEFDVESDAHHTLINTLNEADKNGQDISDCLINVSEKYRNGGTKKYRYQNVKFMVPKNSVNGGKDDISGTMEWHAEDVVYD